MIAPFFDSLPVTASASGSGFGAMAADHLWQSTLFACVAAALALVLRRSQARIRYGLWLAASAKFVIPFALLTALGSQMASHRTVADANPAVYSAVIEAAQPFTAAPVRAATHESWPSVWRRYGGSRLLAFLWLCGVAAVLVGWAIRWQRIRGTIHASLPRTEGREVEILRATEKSIGLRRPIPFVVCPGTLEPGVFGVIRPVLLWPQGISEKLEDAHVVSILAHEAWHVRRRDNLAALAHMVVEALFWFHPLVWWLGARMVDERERACDEAVLHMGNAPGDYAESILKTCKFCIESPLACVSGVSGSNLKRRIVRIMNRQLGSKLSLSGKLLLASLGAGVIAAPVVAGFFNPARIMAQEAGAVRATPMENVTVKASDTAERRTAVDLSNNGISLKGVTVRQLIEMAYGVRDYQLSGGPSWIDTKYFDVEGKSTHPESEPEHGKEISSVHVETLNLDFQHAQKLADESSAAGEPGAKKHSMSIMTAGLSPRTDRLNGRLQATLQSILATRFNLQVRHETQNMPALVLLQGDGGSKLTAVEETKPASEEGRVVLTRAEIMAGDRSIRISRGAIEALAMELGQLLNRPVVDETGLKGLYEMNLHWDNSEDQTEALTRAVEEQLGLRVEQQQAPVDTLSIERIDLPAEN